MIFFISDYFLHTAFISCLINIRLGNKLVLRINFFYYICDENYYHK